MASWFSSSWIFLWIIVLSRKVSADLASTPNYTIHRINVNFDQAMINCSPGVLTTIATEQEAANILGLISKTALAQKEFNFWVGLRKAKNECVVPSLPLRGFKWTEDGSEESGLDRWKVEPQKTCTTVRCTVLQGEFDGLTVTKWGLIPVTCKNTYQFICKQRNGQTRLTSEDRKTTIKPATPEPVTPEPKPAEPESPKHAPPKSKLPTQRPEPETDLKLTTEPELQGPDPGASFEPVPESNLCQTPLIPRSRSLTLDPNNSSRIWVDCWSIGKLELRCWGHPAVWRFLDNSPTNFTTVCQPCSDGFRKDTSGNCVDIDECSDGKPCRHTCLNTKGSYSCVCSDENGKPHDEGSPECTDVDGGSVSGILIPVLVAVAVLVVLVVAVAVTVMCCLMRRSKKRAMKKSENMALKNKEGQDSFATANEKTAT